MNRSNCILHGDIMGDDELADVKASADAAEPGEWRVRGDTVTRYSGAPVATPESLRFMAAARGYVPRLLRCVAKLEETLQNAWAAAKCAENSLQHEKDARRLDAERQSSGKTGPQEDIAKLARLCNLGHFQDNGALLEQMLRSWAGGASLNVQGRLDSALSFAEQHRRELAESRAELDKSHAATRAKLDDWVLRLEAGDVPDSMRESWRARQKSRRRDPAVLAVRGVR